MDADGQNPRPFLVDAHENFEPAWSSGVVDTNAPQVTLEVRSTYGQPMPGIGTNTYYASTYVFASVDSVVSAGPIGYRCVGWQGTGSAPESGVGRATGSFQITTNSVIVWQWETNLLLDVEIEGCGTVTVEPTGRY